MLNLHSNFSCNVYRLKYKTVFLYICHFILVDGEGKQGPRAENTPRARRSVNPALVELDKKDISISHLLPKSTSENQRNRIANNSAEVVIKFTCREIKDKFYQGWLQLKDKSTGDLGLSRISENKLFITESLSQRNKQLLKDLLFKFKHGLHFHFIRTYNVFKKKFGKFLIYHQ